MEASSEHKQDKRQPGILQIAIILTTVCLSVLVTAILGPSLPKMQAYFSDVEGVDQLVPLTMTIPMLVMSFFCVVAGAISDRIGRKWLLVGSAAFYAAIGTAPLYLDSLHAILTSRLVLGVAEAFVMVIGVALIGDFFSGRKRERLLAMQVTVASISAFIFNNLGGILGEFGWRAPYGIYFIGLVLAIMVSIFLWEPPRDKTKTVALSQDQDEPPVQSLMILFTSLLAIVTGLVFLIVPVHFGFLFFDIGINATSKIGMAYGLNAIGVVTGTLVFGWGISDRLPVGKQLCIAYTMMALGFLGMCQAETYLSLTASGVINGIGGGMLLPTMVTWNMRLLPARIRGLGLGAYQSGMFFGNFLAGPAVVWAAGILDGRAGAVMLVGWLLLAGAGVSLYLSRKSRTAAFQNSTLQSK